MVLSKGSINRLTEARARVRIQVSSGEACGWGATYLSDVWAWPDPALTHAQRDGVLRQWCLRIASRLAALVGGEAAHPLELGLRLHEKVCEDKGFETDLTNIPVLARAMCLSPFDAAMHDAVGNALGISGMCLYDVGVPVRTRGDRWFKGQSAVGTIAAMLRPRPLDRLAAWLVVGKQDDIDRDIRPWVADRGYHCLKLKLQGRDVAQDIARTAEVVGAVLGSGCPLRLSIDTNEACPNAAFVLEYLQALKRHHPVAFERLEYFEQPTARDIRKHPQDWRSVTKLKPVLLDEGLTSLDLLPLAEQQGWSGLALKTCKGHSLALVAAAWACEHGQPIALQDLTNPGIAAIHAAIMGAHLPTINGVELNSPQFSPAANEPYVRDWPGLFDVRHGYHRLSRTAPPGLGAAVP